jgi:hypothetical protein
MQDHEQVCGSRVLALGVIRLTVRDRILDLLAIDAIRVLLEVYNCAAVPS